MAATRELRTTNTSGLSGAKFIKAEPNPRSRDEALQRKSTASELPEPKLAGSNSCAFDPAKPSVEREAESAYRQDRCSCGRSWSDRQLHRLRTGRSRLRSPGHRQVWWSGLRLDQCIQCGYPVQLLHIRRYGCGLGVAALLAKLERASQRDSRRRACEVSAMRDGTARCRRRAPRAHDRIIREDRNRLPALGRNDTRREDSRYRRRQILSSEASRLGVLLRRCRNHARRAVHTSGGVRRRPATGCRESCFGSTFARCGFRIQHACIGSRAVA